MLKKKAVRKIIYFMILFPIGLIAAIWVYNNFFMRVDTTEVDGYYDLLIRHGKPSDDLLLNLGVTESDDIQKAINRIKDAMSLEATDIYLVQHDGGKKPAYITNKGRGVMGLALSDRVTALHEKINVLTHELAHIYVWNMDRSLINVYDEEKIVDTSGVFLGLGILILNGLTDDIFFMPGEEYQTEKKFFGYIQPEEFGYLLARYCAEHGIAVDKITPFLTPTGRKYFSIGRTYLARREKPVPVSNREVKGAYWCPKCGKFTRFSLTEEAVDIKCPRCEEG